MEKIMNVVEVLECKATVGNLKKRRCIYEHKKVFYEALVF